MACEKCGGIGYVRLTVPVGHPAFGRAIPCECQRDRLAKRRAERLREQAGIADAELRFWQFDTFRPDQCQPPAVRPAMEAAKQRCIEFAEQPRGWLILQGAFGCGKTHLAYAIASKALADGRAVFASTVPDMLDVLRQGYSDDNLTFEKRFDDMRNAELLVLDDLGTEAAKPWPTEKLYQIINWRYARRLPMVVTTNVDLERRSRELDDRIRSRLLEGTRVAGGFCQLLPLPARDFRPQKREIG
jgi:DNA replication protein DnaC